VLLTHIHLPYRLFISKKKFLGFAEVDNFANVVLNLKADIEWEKTTIHPKGGSGVLKKVK
jgi:hypothetical protein